MLVQEKDTHVHDPSDLLDRDADDAPLPVPLLGPEHISLLEGRYPHAAWSPDALWPWGGPGEDDPPL